MRPLRFLSAQIVRVRFRFQCQDFKLGVVAYLDALGWHEG